MFPLAYSAGIVLWNMMQIWDEATNFFLAPLYTRSTPSCNPPPAPASPDTRILINRVTAPRFAFYTISRRHGEMCEVLCHFWQAEKM